MSLRATIAGHAGREYCLSGHALDAASAEQVAG